MLLLLDTGLRLAEAAGWTRHLNVARRVRGNGAPAGPQSLASDVQSPAAQAYWKLRTHLLFAASDAPRVSPLATSASPLSIGTDFFSSYHPKNRRIPLDGVASASGLPVGERKSGVFTHAEFLGTYANLEKTRLRSGENPLLDLYQNVKFLF